MPPRADAIPPLETDPGALYVLGLLSLRAGRLEQSMELFSLALRLQPQHEGAHRNLVRALLAAGRPAETLAQADRALALLPDEAELHFARGTALNALRSPEPARIALSRAVALDPAHAPAWLNLGNACADLDDFALAERHCRTALALDPGLVEAQASLGYLLTVRGWLPEAIAACEAAIALRPDCVQAHWNLAVAALLAGDLPRGFTEYEWRKRHDRYRRDFISLPGPTWDGSDPSGRTILVHAEQGLGDTIQFARFLSLIAVQGGRPVLACDESLVPLFHEAMPDITVVSRGPDLPPYDAWIDQMSLPRAFGTRLETIPAADGYLVAHPGRRAAWASVLPPGPRIGLAWAGNRLHSNDARRSIPARALAPLLALPGIGFVNLQVGAAAGEQPNLPDLTPLLTDYAETAALIANLDLVLCCDTSVAHLAGALGRPAWVMLPHAPDWRWLRGRDDTPWYSSLRLFRQPVAGDWDSVVVAVVAALAGSGLAAGGNDRGDRHGQAVGVAPVGGVPLNVGNDGG
ncbi:MAG: tetratricopeptide repeat-containing glycosyltransferase family protein [Acetobacteraceae bacterium]|nr:tetratricopeptide repeat-containing glycosyltransferase family protein [Acetobacteraceae bacterium]